MFYNENLGLAQIYNKSIFKNKESFIMAVKCPACGGSTAHKCDHCGDIRCSMAQCPGTMGGPKRHVGNNVTCPTCRKGKMKKL